MTLMDNTQARCKDDPKAYRLAFSPHAEDGYRMKADYCVQCPIMWDCLAYALKNDSYGIWGGTTREYRTELKLNAPF